MAGHKVIVATLPAAVRGVIVEGSILVVGSERDRICVAAKLATLAAAVPFADAVRASLC